jgi:hypothetical protein
MTRFLMLSVALLGPFTFSKFAHDAASTTRKTLLKSLYFDT